MASIFSSSSATSALSTLRLLSAENDQLQHRAATGLKVSKAADNVSFWSISTGMRVERAAMEAVKDSIGLALGIVETALAVADPILEHLQAITSDLLQGRDLAHRTRGLDSPELQALDADIVARTKSIGNLIVGATFNKINILHRPSGKTTSHDLVVGIDTSGGTLTTQSITLDMTQIALIDGSGSSTANFGVLSKLMTDATTGAVRSFFNATGRGPKTNQPKLYPAYFTGTNVTYVTSRIDAHLRMIDTATQATQNVFAYLGTVKSRLEAQMEQTNNLAMIHDTGIGRLVDTDLSEDSARLKAIATQTQLATEMLAIVNGKPSHILELFRA